jgi:subtilase family serine protease
MPGNLTGVVTALSSTTVAAGGSFSFSARASNIGNTSTGAGSTSRIFLSVDPLIDPFDTVLQIQIVPTLAAFTEYVQNFSVNLPGNLAPGTYYIGALADYHNQIAETNEGDNNYNRVTITVTPPQLPNLTEVVTALTSTTVPAGTSFSFSTNTVNLGQNVAGPSTARIYISSDPVINSQDILLASHVSTALNPGAGHAQNFAVNLPAGLAPGTYYIGGVADDHNQIGESNESDNNRNILTITVTAPPPPPAPDLRAVVTALTSTTMSAGGSFSFALNSVNEGNIASSGSTTRVFLSTDTTINGLDTVLAIQTVGSLNPGAGAAQNYVVNLPTNLAYGTYYIGAVADYHNQIGESNESNNNGNRLTITIGPPNLTTTVTALTSTSVLAGGSFSFAARTSNSGGGTAAASTAGVYLSTDPTITTADRLLTPQFVRTLVSGDSAAQNYVINLPGDLATGTYYIGGLADIHSQIAESNEGDNNNNVVAINIRAPEFSINFSGGGTQYQQYQQYFAAAAAYWSRAIVADLPDVANSPWGRIDDLLIEVNFADIDGRPTSGSNTLARAGWDERRAGARGLPYHGTLTIDIADVPYLAADPAFFTDVIMHEIGHVLGLSDSLWSQFGLASGSNYYGANALAAYRSYANNNALNSVPLDAAGAHWNEAIFGNELMTPVLGDMYSPLSFTHPNQMSRLTIGALHDLGYSVNYGAADSYHGPFTPVSTAQDANSLDAGSGWEGTGSFAAAAISGAGSQLSSAIASSFPEMTACYGAPAFYEAAATAPTLVPSEPTKHA